MADSKEAKELRQQIAFLTNLISSAKQNKPQSSYVGQSSIINVHKPIPWQNVSTAIKRKPSQTIESLHKHQKSSRNIFIKESSYKVPDAVESLQNHCNPSKYSFKQNQVVRSNQPVRSNQHVPIASSSVARSEVSSKNSSASSSTSHKELPASNSRNCELKSQRPKLFDKINLSKVERKESSFCDSILNTVSNKTQSKTSECKLSKQPATHFNTSRLAVSQIQSSKSAVTQFETSKTADRHLKTSMQYVGLALGSLQNESKEKVKLDSNHDLLTCMLKETYVPVLESSKVHVSSDISSLNTDMKSREKSSTATVTETMCEIHPNSTSHKIKHSPTPAVESSAQKKCGETVPCAIALTSESSHTKTVGQTVPVGSVLPSKSILSTSEGIIAPGQSVPDGSVLTSKSSHTKTPGQSVLDRSVLTSKPISPTSDNIHVLDQTVHKSALQSKCSLSVSDSLASVVVPTSSSHHGGRFRAHKHSLSKLFRRNLLPSNQNVDLVSKSEETCGLQADFIPLSMSSDSLITTPHSSIPQDCPQDCLTSLDKSANSSIPLSKAENMSSSRDSLKDSFKAMDKSLDSIIPAVSYSLKDSFKPMDKSLDSIIPSKDSFLPMDTTDSLGTVDSLCSMTKSKKTTDNRKSETDVNPPSDEHKISIPNESSSMDKSSIPNSISLVSKSSNPCSPLRKQKVAILLSNLQKTRSKIDDLKENIGGILKRKAQELPKKPLVISSSEVAKTLQGKLSRHGLVDKEKLLKHRKLLGKVWIRQQKAETPVRIPTNKVTRSLIKTKYRIVKGHKSVSKHSLHQVNPTKTFHSSSKFKCFRRQNSLPMFSNVQHVAKIIVGKYKTPQFSTAHSLKWNAHNTQKPWVHSKSTGCVYTATHSWNRRQWRNSLPVHQSSLWKADIARRLQLISSDGHFSTKRTLGLKGRLSDKTDTKPARLVFIHGILYKSSGTKLTKTGNKSVDHRKITLNKATPTVIVRKVNTGAMKTISVRGVKFHMDSSGHSLRRADSVQGHSSRNAVVLQDSSPKISRVDIGGVTYIQTKPGTLVKSSSMRTRVVMSRIKNRSIVSVTAKFRKDNTKAVQNLCKFYNRFGKCRHGEDCPYIHDPDKIAICTRFLRGTCKIEGCLFSHKVSKEKVPVCLYFLRGVCNRDDCPYLHVKVNKDAAVCPDFINGFCPQGEKCKKQHTLVCPTFARTGVCPQGSKCKMIHKRRKLSKCKKPISDPGHAVSHAVVDPGHAVSHAVVDPGHAVSHAVVLGKRSARDAGIHDDGAAVVPSKLQELPSFISLENYNVDDIITPVKEKSANKGRTVCIKPQL